MQELHPGMAVSLSVHLHAYKFSMLRSVITNLCALQCSCRSRTDRTLSSLYVHHLLLTMSWRVFVSTQRPHPQADNFFLLCFWLFQTFGVCTSLGLGVQSMNQGFSRLNSDIPSDSVAVSDFFRSFVDPCGQYGNVVSSVRSFDDSFGQDGNLIFSFI